MPVRTGQSNLRNNELQPQKTTKRHGMEWTLDMYGSSTFAINYKTSINRLDVPRLYVTPVLNVFAYIQKLPNVNGDDILELDAHLAQAPMRLTSIGDDLETKQASLILMSSFTRKLGHWAQ